MNSYADALNAALGHKPAPERATPVVRPAPVPRPLAAPTTERRAVPVVSNVRHLGERIERPPSEYEVACHRAVMESFMAGTLRPWEHYYSLKVKPGAMFGEPINDSPWVFVDGPEPVFVTFTSIPGSGTDALRKRILAQQFFDSLEGR